LFSMAKGKTAARPVRDYATVADFCGLFKTEANRFYFLCRLLTTDSERAEECFGESLESCLRSHRVFREWAQRWATHTIIKTAIQMKESAEMIEKPSQASQRKAEMLLSVVQGLARLDRFVYVMTVFERYSDQECATLLGSTLREVRTARERALAELAKNPELLRATESMALRMTS
jgi:DNA-directed RNA polymerase specialized sigma24 family protein